MLLEISGEITLERMKGWSQSKNNTQLWMCLVVKVKSNSVKKKERKKETLNVRSMNQGKLEVVKQETKRMNFNILGISELKWTGMGEFNSDDYYIYYCGQQSLRRRGLVIKNPPAHARNSRDMSSIPGSERSLAVGIGNPFHGEIPWTGEPSGLQSLGSQRVGHL